MSNDIETGIVDGVMTIRLNRAHKKNAITSDMYGQMAKALEHSRTHADVRACLLLGSPGIFTAGNDIADFLAVAMTGQRGSMAVFDFLKEIIKSEKPIVAGVDGAAIGVGTTMLMHCDYVVASDRSTFRTPFVDLGLVPEAGSSLIGPRIMGHHRAFELLALGEEFTAEDAKSAGFVNRIYSSGAVEESATTVARKLAAKPPEALLLSRNLVRGDREDILIRMEEEAEIFLGRLKSDEAKKAFMAFMNRGK